MLTRVEIDGFKTFEQFSLDLQPFMAIVGPNASGKSNLFDALRFLSLLAQKDLRGAMQDLRGEPEELFRVTAAGSSQTMRFAVEVLLPAHGVDAFGTAYDTPSRRLRYELKLGIGSGSVSGGRRIQILEETCEPIARKDDKAGFDLPGSVRHRVRSAFIQLNPSRDGLLVRQDGPGKSGQPRQLSLQNASQTVLSTITTAEFPHLHALRELLSSINFLAINPAAARSANDRFEDRRLKPDASNLASVLAHLKAETKDENQPEGVLADITTDLSWLIPSVRSLMIEDDESQRKYAFGLGFAGDVTFSSRVISDGTLRLLALLTVLHDPERRGTLCFEEPENGIHEGRVPDLVRLLREASGVEMEPDGRTFQVIVNSHSPVVLAALQDREVVVSDSVVDIDPGRATRSSRTRMRRGVRSQGALLDAEHHLTRFEVERLLRQKTDAA